MRMGALRELLFDTALSVTGKYLPALPTIRPLVTLRCVWRRGALQFQPKNHSVFWNWVPGQKDNTIADPHAARDGEDPHEAPTGESES